MLTVLAKSVDYHAESAQKLKSLEAALEKFAGTIRRRGFDKKLDIALKDPKAYSTEDVLSIAGKIEEKHRHADKVKDAMGLIRKCFRCAGHNHGQLSRLLKFVPNDTYGTIISGGFTIILGVCWYRIVGIVGELTHIRLSNVQRSFAPISTKYLQIYL